MESLVPYAGSPRRVIHKILELAEPQYGEVLYDLGSGKGNIVIEAAKKHPIKCIGIEIDPDLVNESRNRVSDNGLEDRIEIIKGDFHDFKLVDADILTLYLDSKRLKDIEGKVYSELRTSARVVTHDYEFPSYNCNKYVPVLDVSAFFKWWFPMLSLHWVHLYKMDDIRKRKPLREIVQSFWKK